MPIFVWQATARGAWSPSVFFGELPRDVAAPGNAHLYRPHRITDEQYDAAESSGISPLDYLAQIFPPPPPAEED